MKSKGAATVPGALHDVDFIVKDSKPHRGFRFTISSTHAHVD